MVTETIVRVSIWDTHELPKDYDYLGCATTGLAIMHKPLHNQSTELDRTSHVLIVLRTMHSLEIFDRAVDLCCIIDNQISIYALIRALRRVEQHSPSVTLARPASWH
jgi:hypothetical protein